MDETRQLLHAFLKNQELTNSKVTAVQDELLHFRRETNEKFTLLDGRLDKMDSRMDKMDERFDRMDDRFDKMDERFDRMDKRKSLERDLDKLTERLEKVEDYIGFERQ